MRHYIDTEWELSKKPKIPKQIKGKGLRGLLGVISPSKMNNLLTIGDPEVVKFANDVRRWLNYKRQTTKSEWKVFHRYIRWQKRVGKARNRKEG